MAQPADNALNELKRFSGLIHRQPLFDGKLTVSGYYLRFLDYQGLPLVEDSTPPEFVPRLPDILQGAFPGQQLILNMPQHWHASLWQSGVTDIDIILLDSAHQDSVFKRAAFTTDADEHCHVVLVDVQQRGAMDTMQKTLHSHQTVCAMNVDEVDDFQWCLDANIHQFTGQFYTRSRLPQSNKAQPSQHMLLQLLVQLHDPDTDARALAQIINQDVTLSYKLLKLVNSAFFGLPREISDTRQAIVMLGQNTIKTWASLLCLSGVDDKPSELKRIAMQRARMCELLARYYKGQPESFFICGLLSTLDALLDKPLTDIIDGLPLHPDIKLALTNFEGAAGAALRDTIAYEHGQWLILQSSPIPMEILARIYLDAVVWTGELDQQLQD